MNIIINKLQLPYDMKYEIDSFCYDNCGYTSEEIDFKEILKKRYKSNFLRIKIELLAWKNQNLSIIWLKPTKHGKSGYYISDEDERNNIDDALFNNIINKDEWAELMNTFI